MGVMSAVDLVVIHEHPEWQKPLFAALDRRGLRWKPFDLRRAAFSPEATPDLNANSNLRPAIAMEYGFDPFERVVDWLVSRLAGRTKRSHPAAPGWSGRAA